MLKKAIVSVAALSLVASPVLAASSLSVATPMREMAEVDGSDLRGRRGQVVTALIAVGIILLILGVTDNWPFEDDPDSP